MEETVKKFILSNTVRGAIESETSQGSAGLENSGSVLYFKEHPWKSLQEYFNQAIQGAQSTLVEYEPPLLKLDFPWGVASPENEVVRDLERRDLLIEQERLKTQLIEQRRAVLLATRTHDGLRKECDKLLDAVCEVTMANKALQDCLIGKHEGRLCLYESTDGVVASVVGNDIEVVYQKGERTFRQIYNKRQFMHAKTPTEGDSVKAHAILCVVPKAVISSENLLESQDADFRKASTRDSIRIQV
jgi:hypothetical protein